jgi:hypothetical protein
MSLNVGTDSAALESPARLSWNPLRCSGTDLPINLTILVKALAIVLLITNHARILPDPWLPFVPGIDLLPPVLFQKTLQVALVVGSLAIVFNRRVRLSALIVGSTMLLAVVSSKEYYGNNRTFCGLMFFLAGLYQPGGPPFLRWQLALTYFGAGLNKALDPDWQSGVFFENWAAHVLRNPAYLAADSVLPPLALGKIMGWGTSLTELGSVPLLLVPRLQFWGNLANILFQSGLLFFTGSTFSLFFYGMTAASLSFVTWPQAPIRVLYDPASQLALRARRLLEGWDFDQLFRWTQDTAYQAAPDGRDIGDPSAVQLRVGDKIYRGFQALRMIILFNPVTYLVLAGAVAGAGYLPAPDITRRLIVGLSLVILLPPLAWMADTILGQGRRSVSQLAPTMAAK